MRCSIFFPVQDSRQLETAAGLVGRRKDRVGFFWVCCLFSFLNRLLLLRISWPHFSMMDSGSPSSPVLKNVYDSVMLLTWSMAGSDRISLSMKKNTWARRERFNKRVGPLNLAQGALCAPSSTYRHIYLFARPKTLLLETEALNFVEIEPCSKRSVSFMSNTPLIGME